MKPKYKFEGKYMLSDGSFIYEWMQRYEVDGLSRTSLCWIPVDKFWRNNV